VTVVTAPPVMTRPKVGLVGRMFDGGTSESEWNGY
jgi:hypothetical protein